jgi:hypothetical protein
MILQIVTQGLGLVWILCKDLGDRKWMQFGTWCVESPCRAGSLKTVVSELTNCNLDLVAVQEVRWDKGSSQSADNSTFFYGTCFFIHKGKSQKLRR